MRFFWPDRGRAQALGRDPAINVEPFLSADFLKFFLPLAAGVVGWLANERAKRQTEEYTRKEQRYRVLLLSLQGFYDVSVNLQQRQEFLNQLTLCWLYCSDEVVLAGQDFLAKMMDTSGSTQDQKNQSAADLIGAIRRDLLSRRVIRRTALTGREFQRVAVVAPRA